jgi:hypothetical protein
MAGAASGDADFFANLDNLVALSSRAGEQFPHVVQRCHVRVVLWQPVDSIGKATSVAPTVPVQDVATT